MCGTQTIQDGLEVLLRDSFVGGQRTLKRLVSSRVMKQAAKTEDCIAG